MTTHFFWFPLIFFLNMVAPSSSDIYSVAKGYHYIESGVTYSGKAIYSMYCESELGCVCNEEKDGHVFHCERELHLRMRYINYMTAFVYLSCNHTIKAEILKHDYYTLLGLERFMKMQLYISNCPEPPETYASLFRPSPKSSNEIEEDKIPIFSRLNISCEDRKKFPITKEHLNGLSKLSYLEIDCGALSDLPRDLFHGKWPKLISVKIFNTLMERIPDTLFSDLSNLETLVLSNNQIEEIRKEDFLGVPTLQTLYIREKRLRSLEEDAFDYVTMLDDLTLYGTQITRLPKSFGRLANLKSLKLFENSIESIDANDCVGISNLRELKLTNNRITRVDPTCFLHFNQIQTIDISGNYLTNLPDEPILMKDLNSFAMNHNWKEIQRIGRFIVSESLSHLSMRNSSVAYLDPEFLHGLSNLQIVDLSENKLSSLDENFFANNSKLKEVNLSGNRLSTIPSAIFLHNSLLKKLDISSNIIEILPSSLFTHNGLLDSLNLSDNHVKELQKSLLTNLRRLGSLELSKNRIKTIENDTFIDTAKLKKLDLNHNLLENLSTNIFSPFKGHGRLLALDLEGNFLSSLPLLDIPSLEILNLANNSVKNLRGDSFIDLEQIKVLNLSRNNLIELPDSPLVTEKQKLEFLDLSFNQLNDIHENALSEAVNLTNLNLLGNRIKRFYLEWIQSCGKLREIDLSNNGMHFIGYEHFTYGYLPSVKVLKLSDNQISFNYSSWTFDDVRFTWGRISPLIFLPEVQELHLANNSISNIFMDWRNMLLHLRQLDLRHNKLNFLTHQDLLFSSTIVYTNGKVSPYSCSHSLTVDLRHNQIRGVELPTSMLMKHSAKKETNRTYSHATILLDDNPFACGCGLTNFLQLLYKDVVLTSELWRTHGMDWILPAKIEPGNLSCWEPETVRGKKLSEPETWMHHLLPMFGLCSLIGHP